MTSTGDARLAPTRSRERYLNRMRLLQPSGLCGDGYYRLKAWVGRKWDNTWHGSKRPPRRVCRVKEDAVGTALGLRAGLTCIVDQDGASA